MITQNTEWTARLEVDRILKVLSEQSPAWRGNWDIQPLGQGEQAYLFVGQQPAAPPQHNAARKIIIKIYRCATSADRQAFANEKQCLEMLALALPRQRIADWSLHSPSLYYNCEATLAMVMSAVPGMPIDRWLQRSRPTQVNSSAMAQAILSGLNSLWSQKMMYGDLNLKNILVDPARKSIAFVDPGLPHSGYHCPGISDQWYPASRDLAYLLYSVAVSVKSNLRNPPARSRQLSFVKLLLQQFFDLHANQNQLPQLSEEIRRCTQVHLQGIQCSWSASGVWRRLVKQLTQHSLDRLLGPSTALVDGDGS